MKRRLLMVLTSTLVAALPAWLHAKPGPGGVAGAHAHASKQAIHNSNAAFAGHRTHGQARALERSHHKGLRKGHHKHAPLPPRAALPHPPAPPLPPRPRLDLPDLPRPPAHSGLPRPPSPPRP
jgi:hypothetical protein